MKKLKYSKKIITETVNFQNIIDNYCNKLNKEYAKNINDLLKKIAIGENLDFNMLKNKYIKLSDDSNIDNLKNNEVDIVNDLNKSDIFDVSILKSDDLNNKSKSKSKSELESELEDDTETEDIIFDKIILDGKNFYYENKDNGKIYDTLSNIVGIYKNKEFIINKVQIIQLF